MTNQDIPFEDAISRDTAIKYLCTNMNWYDEDGYEAEYDEKVSAITDLINSVPSITTVRPKGKWLGEKARRCMNLECSVCNQMIYGVLSPYNFCPNCGADMREVENADSN